MTKKIIEAASRKYFWKENANVTALRSQQEFAALARHFQNI